MSYEIQTYLANNITLVYDALPLERIDRNALRTILETDKIMGMDTPEILVMFAPTLRVVFQLGDKRMRITDQSNRPAGESPIWSMAFQANNVLASLSNLVAYGFNYDVSLVWRGALPASAFLKTHFLSNEQELAELLGGEIQRPVPRIIFTRGEVLYDLILELLSESLIKAHINVHFQENTLPSEERLQESFITEFNAFLDTLEKCLEE